MSPGSCGTPYACRLFIQKYILPDDDVKTFRAFQSGFPQTTTLFVVTIPPHFPKRMPYRLMFSMSMFIVLYCLIGLL